MKTIGGNLKNYIILNRYGWPVETIKGRPILNFVRLLIHGRSLMRRDEWKRRCNEAQRAGYHTCSH